MVIVRIMYLKCCRLMGCTELLTLYPTLNDKLINPDPSWLGGSWGMLPRNYLQYQCPLLHSEVSWQNTFMVLFFFIIYLTFHCFTLKENRSTVIHLVWHNHADNGTSWGWKGILQLAIPVVCLHTDAWTHNTQWTINTNKYSALFCANSRTNQ